MEFVDLKAELRESGKKFARRLRKLKKIPAVLYGEGVESLPLTVDERDFLAVTHGRTLNVFIKLAVEEKNYNAMVKEVQRHPVKPLFLHVDFQKIAMKEKIHASVPITVVGESIGVKEGGILEHGLREIEVSALPKDIPDHIEVDVTELKIGDTLRVSDLSSIDGVEILSHPEDVVLTVVPPKVVVEEVVAEKVVEEPELIRKEAGEEAGS